MLIFDRRAARRLLAGFALVGLAFNAFLTGARAQNIGAGTLGNLMVPRGGRLKHFASTDPLARNNDFRAVRPGEIYTLVDYKGAGIVRRWWITLAPRNNVAIQRQGIIRCYWDGETAPSVEVPASDFFGMGFGEWHDFRSLPLNMSSGGYNCYWPMPFHKSARITFENRSKVRVDALYYNVDIETHDRLPSDLLYFHAQFHRQRPTVRGQSYVLLDTAGRGQYVGTLLSMQPMRGHGIGFLEGNEQVTIDGEAAPSIEGTGTEDYFSSGWYFDTGIYSAPYHGVNIKDESKGRISAYRWHIEDAIPFEKSIHFAIQHGAVNDADADYSSVAFYYQTHPHPPFTPLPADLLPADPVVTVHFPGIVEGESLIAGAHATGGSVTTQDMSGFNGTWSGDSHLFWEPTAPGAKLTLTVTAPAAGEYMLTGYFTRALDYGNLRLRVNGGDPLPATINGYAETVSPTGPINMGRVTLTAGPNKIEVEVTGKDARSTSYRVGIDGFVLKP